MKATRLMCCDPGQRDGEVLDKKLTCCNDHTKNYPKICSNIVSKNITVTILNTPLLTIPKLLKSTIQALNSMYGRQ
jgi:hypothetical protein